MKKLTLALLLASSIVAPPRATAAPKRLVKTHHKGRKAKGKKATYASARRTHYTSSSEIEIRCGWSTFARLSMGLLMFTLHLGINYLYFWGIKQCWNEPWNKLLCTIVISGIFMIPPIVGSLATSLFFFFNTYTLFASCNTLFLPRRLRKREKMYQYIDLLIHPIPSQIDKIALKDIESVYLYKKPPATKGKKKDLLIITKQGKVYRIGRNTCTQKDFRKLLLFLRQQGSNINR